MAERDFRSLNAQIEFLLKKALKKTLKKALKKALKKKEEE